MDPARIFKYWTSRGWENVELAIRGEEYEIFIASGENYWGASGVSWADVQWKLVDKMRSREL